MKTKLLALALLLVVPMVLSAQVEIWGFRVNLSPSNEEPPVFENSNGNADIWVKVYRDAIGTVTRAIVDFDIQFQLRRPNTLVSASHIHRGAADVSGPVVISVGISPISRSTPGGTTSIFEQVDITSSSGLEAVQGIISNPEGYYLNVHTAKNPSGELRGQLRARQ